MPTMNSISGHWTTHLKTQIAFAEDRWQFKTRSGYRSSPFSFVAPVLFKNGGEAVLKICPPGESSLNEIHAIKCYQGSVMCRLHDVVPERGILLLEKLDPGNSLKTLRNDHEATLIASRLIREMRSVSFDHHNRFPSVSLWMNGLKDLRRHFNGGTGPLPESAVLKAEHICAELCASQKNTYLLHGDLHHENILSNGKEWRLIDPKGVVGETEYELIPFLMNNLPPNGLEHSVKYRAVMFSRELQLKVDRIYAWGLCHSVLSAWWAIDDDLAVSDNTLHIISLFNKLAE
jgi:streptomycin 6-kinase